MSAQKGKTTKRKKSKGVINKEKTFLYLSKSLKYILESSNFIHINGNKDRTII